VQPDVPATVESSQARTIVSLDQVAQEPTRHANALLREMLSSDEAERPAAAEVALRLQALLRALQPAPAADGESGTHDGDTRHQARHHTVWFDVGTRDPAGAPAAGGLPDRLGHYRVVEKLGEGGMGAVYRAEDLADQSVVAIKVLSGRGAQNSGAVKRLLKEARLLAEVNNPYVANLIEVNEDHGTLYLVLEYVPGKSLDTLLTDGRKLDETLALTLIADVARALVDAHKQGIVHRDIKPDNILLVGAPDGGNVISDRPRVKLTDFGLARHTVESDSLNVTRHGAVVGTPLYMAPEQCTGGTIDARTDVYALGATLYHVLAGRPPFLADSPLAVMSLQTRSSSTPPSATAPGSWSRRRWPRRRTAATPTPRPSCTTWRSCCAASRPASPCTPSCPPPATATS
jgi:serine/threonine protein kinase